MKKKKLKKMINKFALVDDIQHLHERIDALEKIKVDSTNRHLHELDGVIEKLLDSDNKFLDKLSHSDSDTGITFENCYQIYRCMADRGATQEEVNNIKNYFNKYIFRCEMFKFYKTNQETEEKNDC